MARGLGHYVFDMPVPFAIGFHTCAASIVFAAGACLGGGRRTSCWAAVVYAVFVATLSSFYNLDQDSSEDTFGHKFLVLVVCAVVAIDCLCRRNTYNLQAHAQRFRETQQGLQQASQQGQQQHASQRQQHQQHELDSTTAAASCPELCSVERPITPQQQSQQQVRPDTGRLSPLSESGSSEPEDSEQSAEDADLVLASQAHRQIHTQGHALQHQQHARQHHQHVDYNTPYEQDGASTLPALLGHVESWAALPEAVFADVMAQVSGADIGNMRCVCTHWFDTAGRSITTLRPSSLPVLDLVEAFPSLKTLDLSHATKDISPSKLRHLRELPVLEELTLGCHHRLIASTVTDSCLAELVGLSSLKHLNLSQCVHVRDAGMMSLMNLCGLASLNISGCVAITDIGIMMVAQLTGLTSLEMPWCLKITNIGLSALTPLTKLSNLNISGCQLITEQGIACLGTFTNLRKLGLLNLGYSKICVTDVALQRLSSLTKLESLNIGLNIGTMQPLHKAVTDASMGLISSRFKELTQLGLMSLDISDDGVKCLSQLSKLQALNLRGCSRVSGACMQHLSCLTGITDLCLLHNPRLAVDDACVAAVARLPNIKILGLGNHQVQPAVSDTCLVPMTCTKQLLVLSLAFFKGRFGPDACAVVGQMTQLQHLDLQGSVHADVQLMRAVGGLNQLQSLHLSRCDNIDDAALQCITGLTSLHTLNISICSKVTDGGLAAVTKLQNLTHLLAQHCRAITDAGVALLGRLERLKVLDLSMCERITGSGFLAFGGCTRMATLSLNGCSSLNDSGLRAVGRITSLTKLDLSSCRLITDVGVSYLSGLGELTGLDLAACELVGDAALAIIAAHMRQLATLKVNGCTRVTDAGLASVCDISSLLTLHLDRCIHISDAGLKQLTRLHGLTSLRISRCRNITDAGVAQLSKLSRLSTLSLAQCPLVTDVGLLSLAPLTTLASLEF